MRTIPTVDADTLASWLDRDEAVVVDVREERFFHAGHIPQAHSMPLSRFDPAALPATGGRRLVFNCELGIASERAVERARGAAPDAEILHLGGGIRAWRAGGRPTDGGGRGPIDLVRQVQIAAGSIAVVGSLLAAVASPWWLLLPGVVGAGLVFAGAAGSRGIAALWAGGARLGKKGRTRPLVP